MPVTISNANIILYGVCFYKRCCLLENLFLKVRCGDESIRIDADDVQAIDLYAVNNIQGNKNKDLVNVINESGLAAIM